MTPYEWQQIAAIIDRLWPGRFEDQRAEAWWPLVAGRDFEAVKASVNELAVTSKYRPALSEVLAGCRGGTDRDWQVSSQRERADTWAGDDPLLGPRSHLDHDGRGCEVCRKIIGRHRAGHGTVDESPVQSHCTSCGHVLDWSNGVGACVTVDGGCGLRWA